MDPWVIYHNGNQQPPPGVKRTIEQKHPALGIILFIGKLILAGSVSEVIAH